MVTSLLNVIIAQKLGLEGNLKHCSAVPTNVKFEYMQILAEQFSHPNKIQKVNSSNPSITNYFDSSAEVDVNKRESKSSIR